LEELVPELGKLYPGDELNLSSFPGLKQIIQTGHTGIRGVIKYKDSMSYLNPKNSLHELPENSGSDLAFESYSGGRKHSEHTSQQLSEAASKLWSDHFSDDKFDLPVFMSLDLETPLGLAAFLANNANLRKVFIPSSFNMAHILKCIELQGSSHLVCDADFFQVKPPSHTLDAMKDKVKTVKKVLVGSKDGKGAGSSEIFGGANASSIDAFKLE